MFYLRDAGCDVVCYRHFTVPLTVYPELILCTATGSFSAPSYLSVVFSTSDKLHDCSLNKAFYFKIGTMSLRH